MIFATILAVTTLSILLAELAGRGRVIYGRILGLTASFIFFNSLSRSLQ